MPFYIKSNSMDVLIPISGSMVKVAVLTNRPTNEHHHTRKMRL